MYLLFALLLMTLTGPIARAQDRPRASELEFLVDRGSVVADGDTLDLTDATPYFRCEGLDLLYPRESLANGDTIRFVRARALRLETSLRPGTYEARAVLLGLPGTASPMEIWSFGTPLVTGIEVPENTRQEVTFSFEIAPDEPDFLDTGVLVWKPTAGDRVSLASLDIRPASDAARLDPVDSKSAGDAGDPEMLRAQLRRIADYLLTYQVPGFHGFDYSSTAWWEASISIRTLLAAAQLSGETRYHEAAQRAMEAFLASQLEDGGFCAYLEGMQDPTAVRRKPRTCDTSNRADVGSITACLSLYALTLPEAERAPWLAAHERYLERKIYGQGFADGSYPNGLFEGREFEHPYSVATGTTALSLAAYYAATGDEQALRAAEDAARFLAGTFEESGAVRFYFHDLPKPEAIPSTWHHNLYYLLEGMLAVHRITEDAALRAQIEDAFRRYLYGPEGVTNVLETDRWITVGTRRNLSKGNGLLAILVGIREVLGPDPKLDQWIAAGAAALGDPAVCSTYAVLLPPYRPSSEKTTICTAFAGLSIANAIEPGIVFPTREARP